MGTRKHAVHIQTSVHTCTHSQNAIKKIATKVKRLISALLRSDVGRPISPASRLASVYNWSKSGAGCWRKVFLPVLHSMGKLLVCSDKLFLQENQSKHLLRSPLFFVLVSKNPAAPLALAVFECLSCTLLVPCWVHHWSRVSLPPPFFQ